MLLIIPSLFSKNPQVKISWYNSWTATGNLPHQLPSCLQKAIFLIFLYIKTIVRVSKLCSDVAVHRHVLTIRFNRKFWSNIVLTHASYVDCHILGMGLFWQSVNIKSCFLVKTMFTILWDLVALTPPSDIKSWYAALRLLVCCPFSKRVIIFLNC